MKKLSKILLISLLAVLLAVGSASALAFLKLSDGTTTIEIQDNGSGDTSSSTLGVVTWVGALGNFTVNISTGVSKDVLGSATSPIIDLNSVNVGGPGTLTVSFSDTDFTGSGLMNYDFDIGGTTDGTAAATSYFDLGNVAFAETTLIGDLGSLGTGAFAGSDDGTFDLGVDSVAYSLTLVVDLTHAGASDVSSFDTELQASSVPEPATMLLLGSGLIGLVGFRRKFIK